MAYADTFADRSKSIFHSRTPAPVLIIIIINFFSSSENHSTCLHYETRLTFFHFFFSNFFEHTATSRVLKLRYTATDTTAVWSIHALYGTLFSTKLGPMTNYIICVTVFLRYRLKYRIHVYNAYNIVYGLRRSRITSYVDYFICFSSVLQLFSINAIRQIATHVRLYDIVCGSCV